MLISNNGGELNSRWNMDLIQANIDFDLELSPNKLQNSKYFLYIVLIQEKKVYHQTCAQPVENWPRPFFLIRQAKKFEISFSATTVMWGD